jgi:hypothetical protein
LPVPLFHFYNAPPLPSGNRYLYNNALTSLKVGVFDKNTALTYLYVDPSARGRIMPLIASKRGAVGECCRKRIVKACARLQTAALSWLQP